MKILKKLFTPKDVLPSISSPYNQAVKKQQETLLFSLIIALSIAGFYSYFYVQNQIKAENKVKVIVIAQDLEAPHTLTESDLSHAWIPRALLPQGYFLDTKRSEAIGRTLTLPVKAQQVLLSHFTESGMNPNSISAQFEQWFALSMDEDWFVAKLPNLKANDRIDLVVSNPNGNLEETTVLARNLKVIAIRTIGNKRSLIINTTEEEARAILFSRGLKLPMQVLVHSAINSDSQ